MEKILLSIMTKPRYQQKIDKKQPDTNETVASSMRHIILLKQNIVVHKIGELYAHIN